jgi:membrane-bound lytic murein transglycosylase B
VVSATKSASPAPSSGAPALVDAAKDTSRTGGGGRLGADGIPVVALHAYRSAADRMAKAEPGCGLRWYLLAGIGRVESDHGRVGGAVLHADGTSTPRIIGPALDGVHWAYVPAPPNGKALDGDAVYAHALGPMQFIPTTWDLYSSDGDDDGRANVFDLDDAALGAARFLCASGGNLRQHANQVRALLAYNQSTEYAAQVLAVAGDYRSGRAVPQVPVIAASADPTTSAATTSAASTTGATTSATSVSGRRRSRSASAGR